MTATDLFEALGYKSRMFCIPIEVPTNTLYESKSVYKNASIPESTLKKKDISICYHKCRESVASGVAWISMEGTDTNLDDLFNNMLVHIRHKTLLDKFTY